MPGMRRALGLQLTVLLAGVALAGCAGHPAGDGRLADEGRRVFARAGCGGCHTLASAHATGKLGPDFDTSEQLTRSEILMMLDAGVGGMPSFRHRLSAREQAAVTAFLYAALQRRR